MRYKAGQIMSVITKDGKKYLVRIKKADNITDPCHKCSFCLVHHNTRQCTLSNDDQIRCSLYLPSDCNLKILYECQQTKKEE